MADRCPFLHDDDEGTQWCGLAEQEHRIEDLADRMAATCTDPALVVELAELKERRAAWD